MLSRIEQLMTSLARSLRQIAHDLKTPLSRLRNRVEAALGEPDGGPVYREALERTIEEADGLIKTFNALLSIARLEAGAGGENRETLDVAGLADDLAELYEPAAEERGLVLRASTDEPIFVHADRQLLGQAIANLLDNAIKYGAPSDGAPVSGASPRSGSRRVSRGPWRRSSSLITGLACRRKSASACSAASCGSKPAGPSLAAGWALASLRQSRACMAAR